MMEAGHNPFDQKYFYRDTLSDGELDQDDEFINNYHMGTWFRKITVFITRSKSGPVFVGRCRPRVLYFRIVA